jgi:hypothetical protein
MALKSPEMRAKMDKCTLVASVDHGRLRFLGVSNEPLIILEGQVCELNDCGIGSRSIRIVLQGRFFDKQGNYRSTAHGDKPAGDVSFRGQTGHHEEAKECRLMTLSGLSRPSVDALRKACSITS